MLHSTSCARTHWARAHQFPSYRHLALSVMNEWILYASFADEQPCVPEAEVLNTLTHIWATSIYAAPV
jgi:hypothetical protein